MALLRTCTLKLHYTQDDIYSHITVNDMMNTVVYNSGFVTIDWVLAIVFAKTNYHAINVDKSFDEFVEENETYYWQPTRYGEMICKRDCETELV